MPTTNDPPPPIGERPPQMVDVHIRLMTVEAINIREGDTLLVQISPSLSRADVDRMRNVLARDLPGVKVMLVPALGLVVQPGPQLDIPARPLIDPGFRQLPGGEVV